jgi:hypothetical protein
MTFAGEYLRSQPTNVEAHLPNPSKPAQTPGETDHTRNHEKRSPAKPADGNTACEARERNAEGLTNCNDRVRNSSTVFWKTPCKDFTVRRVGNGFCNPEHKPDRKQGGESVD